jgi:hypothetical protein
MKDLKRILIFNICIYLIVSFVMWDIQWIKNLETMHYSARYLSLVVFMIVNFYFVMLSKLL